MLRLCLTAYVIASALGCGGAPTRGRHTQLESTIVDLESSARRDRDKMRDLENEVHVLKGELRRREGAPVPRLPVEVRAPAPAPASVPAPSPPAPDEELVLLEEDGVEVVYVGDAAKDGSVRPERLPSSWQEPREAVPARASRAQPDEREIEPDIDTLMGERIEITDDVGPTVARQLREAPLPVRRVSNPLQEAAPLRESAAPARESAAPVRETAADRDDPRAQYKRYYDALRAGNHMYAIAGFRNFIERYPGHDHADNARYWLAEAYYDKRDYRLALAEFRKVVSDYPGGNKVPDALLKIGFCHVGLGELDDARAALRRVVQTYPGSSPAALAAERLESLERK